jgi:aldehyde dehydrogenase (NAD+)/aldehyde dehydrogenase
MIYQLNMNRVKPRELWEFWVNQYNTYPAHASLVVLKNLDLVENHKMALDHYRVVKNRLISYDKEPVEFF